MHTESERSRYYQVMPGTTTHQQIGGFLCGTTSFGCASAAGLSLLPALAEGLGGYIVGRSASTWADMLEPATSSYHRDVAHSVMFTVVGSKLILTKLDQCRWRFVLRPTHA